MKLLIPHHFVKWKQIAWPYCVRCGLISLKNKATEKAIKKGCNAD